MTEEVEEGPDPNDLRRHAKRMYTEMQYRQKYRRIDFYKPNEKQREFHNLMQPEVMLRAGNQLGKTHAAGAQFTMDALAIYPEWYEGRRFLTPPTIERPFEWMGWYSCTTSTKVRDGAQLKLLGPVRSQGGLGTGLIPLDNIVGRPTMARGIPDFVDSTTLRRETGGMAIVRGKTYEMGREAYQGEPIEVNWLDEDVSRDDASIYGECLARKTTTRGRIICSLTPLLGQSPLRKRFKARVGGDCAEVLMTIYDCAQSKGGHIPDEDIPGIIASYDENERQTRAFGADMQGEGAVFAVPIERIKYTRDPATFPLWWRWLWGLDFRHSGSATSGHPFAAALVCHDTDNDAIYVVHTLRMHGLAPLHVAAIKKNPMWDAPVSWPHDGGRGAGIVSGDTVAQTYRKLGLAMRPGHATFPAGGYDFGAGLDEMENRLGSNRLLFASHLSELHDEYQGYHRVNGLVNKIDDDLLSAVRTAMMDIRYARRPADFARALQARRGETGGLATGTDFDVFGGEAA
jgi:phage terminase large subunit-like protein